MMIRMNDLAKRFAIQVAIITKRMPLAFAFLPALALLAEAPTQAQPAILAGTAKIDITDHAAGPVNDPL